MPAPPALEPAVFRPPLRQGAAAIVLGGVGGGLLGTLAGLPFVLAGLMGAVAAVIAVVARQLGGVAVIAAERGLVVRGREVIGPAGAAQEAEGIDARWGELRLGFGESPRHGGPAQRYAIVADARGRSFAFADLAGQGPCAPVRGLDLARVPVVDLRHAPLLLALVVQRIPAWDVLPPPLQPPPLATPDPAAGGAAERDADAAPAAGRPRLGFLGLVAKLGATVAKGLKTANLGWAAASAAAYTFVFSWEFALALLLQLFVHEYGHVHAMRRTGMRVRGMYFVPFLGAVAVTEDAFSSRRQQAYVALNGPIWGSLFTLLPAGAYALTRDPIFAAITAWWAVLNLFNLLPIVPLDGGRVLQALASSFSSALGLAVTGLALAAAVAVGTWLNYELVWFVAVLGAMELAAEAQGRAGGRALRLLPERARFGADHFRWLRAVVGPPLGAPSEGPFLRNLEQVEKAARAAPLRPGELAAWGVLYAGLAAGLLALIHFMAHIPGADAAARLLG